MRNMNWTVKNIQLLKELYLKEMPLKQIAFKLGRSLTSVNKQLQRSGIRPIKPRVSRTHKAGFAFLNQKKKHQRVLPLPRTWFYLEEIIRWLVSENISVKPTYWNGQGLYLINGVLMNATQVFTYANDLKMKKGMPIFLGIGITQE